MAQLGADSIWDKRAEVRPWAALQEMLQPDPKITAKVTLKPLV